MAVEGARDLPCLGREDQAGGVLRQLEEGHELLGRDLRVAEGIDVLGGEDSFQRGELAWLDPRTLLAGTPGRSGGRIGIGDTGQGTRQEGSCTSAKSTLELRNRGVGLGIDRIAELVGDRLGSRALGAGPPLALGVPLAASLEEDLEQFGGGPPGPRPSRQAFPGDASVREQPSQHAGVEAPGLRRRGVVLPVDEGKRREVEVADADPDQTGRGQVRREGPSLTRGAGVDGQRPQEGLEFPDAHAGVEQDAGGAATAQELRQMDGGRRGEALVGPEERVPRGGQLDRAGLREQRREREVGLCETPGDGGMSSRIAGDRPPCDRQVPEEVAEAQLCLVRPHRFVSPSYVPDRGCPRDVRGGGAGGPRPLHERPGPRSSLAEKRAGYWAAPKLTVPLSCVPETG